MMMLMMMEHEEAELYFIIFIHISFLFEENV
jgi:hypothetical protein